MTVEDPNYASKLAKAFQYGRSLFVDRRPSSVHPDDLKARLADMNLEEINAVRRGMGLAEWSPGE